MITREIYFLFKFFSGWLFKYFCSSCTFSILRKLRKDLKKKNLNKLLYGNGNFNLFVFSFNGKKFNKVPFNNISINNSCCYNYNILKSDGNKRKITAYHPDAKFFSLKILFLLNWLLPPIPNYFHGSVKYKGVGTALESLDSLLNTNSCLHLFKSDITKFYPSVDLDILSSFLSLYLPSDLVETIIQLMKTSGEPGLATGNPLSPRLCIFFLQMILKDFPFNGLIYFDDFVMFSNDSFSLNSSVAALKQLLLSYGLVLSHEKSSFHSFINGIAHSHFHYLGFTIISNCWFRKHNLITTVGTLNKDLVNKTIVSSKSPTSVTTKTAKYFNFGCKHLKL